MAQVLTKSARLPYSIPTRVLVLRWIAIGLLLIWLVAPMIPLLIWSVSVRWFFPSLLPSELSSRAWEYVFSPTSGEPPALRDTTIIAISVTIISVVIGVPVGRALGLHQFWGKRLIELLMLATTNL